MLTSEFIPRGKRRHRKDYQDYHQRNTQSEPALGQLNIYYLAHRRPVVWYRVPFHPLQDRYDDENQQQDYTHGQCRRECYDALAAGLIVAYIIVPPEDDGRDKPEYRQEK